VYYVCALNSFKKNLCWGRNGSRQLIDDAMTPMDNHAPISASTMIANFTAHDPNHPHAMTALSNGDQFTYDNAGNMVCRYENGVKYNQVFDADRGPSPQGRIGWRRCSS
jgi:hypothetical protein